jgi:hypothetical protein
MISTIHYPCCKKPLYQTGRLVESPAINGIVKGSPKLQSDKDGYFMKCPHCSKRIVMVSTPSPVGAGFDLGDVQLCADCN